MRDERERRVAQLLMELAGLQRTQHRGGVESVAFAEGELASIAARDDREQTVVVSVPLTAKRKEIHQEFEKRGVALAKPAEGAPRGILTEVAVTQAGAWAELLWDLGNHWDGLTHRGRALRYAAVTRHGQEVEVLLTDGAIRRHVRLELGSVGDLVPTLPYAIAIVIGDRDDGGETVHTFGSP